MAQYPGEEQADFRGALAEFWPGVPEGKCNLRFPILSWGRDFRCIDAYNEPALPAHSVACIPVSTRARAAVQKYGKALARLHQVKFPGEPLPPGVQMARTTGDVNMTFRDEAHALLAPAQQGPWSWSCESWLPDDSCACVYQGLMRIEGDLRHAAVFADWVDAYRKSLERGRAVGGGGSLKAAGKVAAIGTAGAAVTALLMLWARP